MFIRGEANEASIELSEQEGLSKTDGSEYYRVTLRENQFKVSACVYAFDPKDDSLGKFFTELASDWRGWDGSRKWMSLEGEFQLECQHDGVGHVDIIASLHSNPYDHGWSGQIRFAITAGELEEVSTRVNRFFAADCDP